MKAKGFRASAFVAVVSCATTAIAAPAEPSADPTRDPATDDRTPSAAPAENTPSDAPAQPTPVPNAEAHPLPVAAPPPPPPVLLQQAPLAPRLPPRSRESEYDDAGVPDDGRLGAHQVHTYLTLGVRTTLVKSRGFDVFATNDALTQASVALGRVLFAEGPWSFASALAWDVGGRESSVRGAATSLTVHRFTLNPEARYHLLRRLYAFGRVGAGAALVNTSIDDAPSGQERSRLPLCFTLDASLGAAWEVLGNESGQSHVARGWLVLDGGYLVTTSTHLTYASSGNSPARAAPISFGELALSGATARLSAFVTF